MSDFFQSTIRLFSQLEYSADYKVLHSVKIRATAICHTKVYWRIADDPTTLSTVEDFTTFDLSFIVTT